CSLRWVEDKGFFREAEMKMPDARPSAKAIHSVEQEPTEGNRGSERGSIKTRKRQMTKMTAAVQKLRQSLFAPVTYRIVPAERNCRARYFRVRRLDRSGRGP